MFKTMNWAGVIVALIVGELLGMLWYGMLFEEQWTRLSGVTMTEGTDTTVPMLIGVVNTLVAVLGLAWLTSRLGDSTWVAGAKTGLIAGVVFACTTAALNFIYAQQDTGLVPIDFGYLLVLYGLAGAIVAGFRLKLAKPAAA
ncbi:MAG TPA: DUF1761 domain-containing protein [Caulobacteraceae bacterium]|nr:DUF1761 domain-containing protein [Caulobacteraceae bacterium]